MEGPTQFRALPASARALVVGLCLAASALGVVVVPGTDPMSVPGFVALAACVAAADGLRFSLPYRGGGVIRFTLVDAAVTGGLVVASPATVVLATAVGVLVWQGLDRLPIYKIIYNQSQHVLAVGAAALVMQALSASEDMLSPRRLLAVFVALGVMLAVNTVTVSGAVCLSWSRSLRQAVQRMLPTNAIMTVGSGSLGLLAVLVSKERVWALPALLCPLLVVYTSSRHRVTAQLARERSLELVRIEHELSAASEPAAIATVLVGGVSAGLGCSSAVWRDGAWVTPPPAGTGPCRVSPALSRTMTASVASLGPAVRGTCLAVGLGDGALVVWWHRGAPDDDARSWLEDVARFARARLDRIAVSSALGRERATLRAVVNGSSDAIFVLDGHGVVLLCNPAMARLIGESAAQLVGQHVSAVLGEGPWAVDGVHEHERPTGIAQYADTRLWRVAITSVRDQKLHDLRVGIVHDVSAQRRVDRMKEDLLAIVSHELRTPLTPIKAVAQLLSRTWEHLDDAERHQLLTQIEERSDHLARLVDDMLLVAQMSGDGRHGPRPTPRPVDVAVVARDAVTDLAGQQLHHRVVYTGPEALDGCTDPTYLRQVLAHLVENGCKFSPAGSMVTVTLRAEGSDAVLCVTDRGRGVAPEDFDRIFERFERVEDPLLMRTSGAGLGLYIVRALTEALGGSVMIDSAPGQGTTVVLRFPLRQPEEQRRRRASTRA